MSKKTMDRRELLKALGILGPGAAALLALPSSVFASSLLDVIGKSYTKKGSKDRKLVEGIGILLRSGQEISFQDERTIGESLGMDAMKRFGLPVKDKTVQNYVNLLGLAVARDSERPDIPYKFAVLDSPVRNAFSCPGGIIFVSKGLIMTLKSEAQLACVLAHEVAHVAHKDALRSIKQAKFFEGVSKITTSTMKGKDGREFKGMIDTLQKDLFERGLDKKMEFSADLSAMDYAYRAGYSPNGMPETLVQLMKYEKNSIMKGSWYSTHPPLPTRIYKCRQHLKDFKDWKSLRTTTGRLPWYQARLGKKPK